MLGKFVLDLLDFFWGRVPEHAFEQHQHCGYTWSLGTAECVPPVGLLEVDHRFAVALFLYQYCSWQGRTEACLAPAFACAASPLRLAADCLQQLL